ncbi:MAG: LacI family transcriptional regulator [Chloroflexota bacterium]|nr:LacI family transcriptional regulator [Chloroflexota bacterium]
MTVSIYDIAKQANVSPSTVSRALNGHPRIGAETTEYIRQLAEEMGYVPSTVAKSLTLSKTWTVGMVMTSISDPFMATVAEGVEAVASAHGYKVFLSTSPNHSSQEFTAVRTLQERRVDGVIIISSHLFEQYSWLFSEMRVPFVLVNEQDKRQDVPWVAIDDTEGAKLAVDHLIDLGHRRIGYIGVTNRPKSNQYRFEGYQAALQEAGVSFDEALVCNPEPQGHLQRGEAALASVVTAGVTAVFCYNDVTAIGLLSACHKQGVAVPDDLSVIGFDDIEMASYTIPPLTTIRQPCFQLGQLAMGMLLDLINGEEPESQLLPVELVVRNTTRSLQRD